MSPISFWRAMFDQTRQLFSKWLLYGIGTLFSLAVLSVMVALALDMVLAVSAAFWVGNFTGANQEGINSMALQQGGLGLILTVLIVTAPPMAASFFQGVLGHFGAYSAFNLGNSQTADGMGKQPGVPGYAPRPSMAAGNEVSQAPAHPAVMSSHHARAQSFPAQVDEVKAMRERAW